VNGRTAVVTDDFSVVTDMRVSLLGKCDYETKPARLVSTPHPCKALGLLPGLVTGLLPGVALPGVLITASNLASWRNGPDTGAWSW